MLNRPNPRPSFSELDERITKWWKQNKIFEKSVENRDGAERYIFYDGPPFMSGSPHYATLLSSLPKDVIPRYQTMKGKMVERVWGWDCHGLPIENKVEKELGLNGRAEIEEHGLQGFIEKCYEWNRVGIENWRWYIDKIGRWADLDNAYRTMDQSYMETIWWTFKQMWENDLIYKGLRTSLFSTDSSTPVSNFEVSMDADNYRDTEDIAIYTKFRLTDRSAQELSDKYKDLTSNIYLVAWTTTPWTIPANFALALNPEARYVAIELDGETLIIAKDRHKDVLQRYENNYKLIGEIKASNLSGLQYQQIYDFLDASSNDCKVYESEYVTTEDGTGILHIAPAYGEADFKIGQEWGLTFQGVIDDAGIFEVGNWKGTYLRDANPLIAEDLDKKGNLLYQEKYVHRLPYYRYDNPLIYKTQDNYFVNVEKLRKQLIESNDQINWVPSHFKEGRFKHILETAPDWSISRSRYWGTVMPIWESEDGEPIIVGSRDELMELVNSEQETGSRVQRITLSLNEKSPDDPKILRAFIGSEKLKLKFSATQKTLTEVREQFCGETAAEAQVKLLKPGEQRAYYLIDGKPLDMHRPFIDEVEFTANGKRYTRVKETLDVWMDSGSMPFAQFHYPFTDKEIFENNFPGDFIAEYTGQIRAWFYVLHLISNALYQKPAFKNVLVTGVLAGTDGRKMSKSFGNYPDPKATLEKYGAEALRLYFLGSVIMRGEDMSFSEDDLRMQTREFLIPLWNIYKYFVTYSNLHSFVPDPKFKPEHQSDRWILSVLDQKIALVDTALSNYDIPQAIRSSLELINEISKWYIRINRDRFNTGDSDAINALYLVLSNLLRLVTPIIPFTTEHIYRETCLKLEQNLPESIHLTNYPEILGNLNEELEEQMQLIRQVCDLGQSMRTSNGLKVRQPLASITINKKLPSWGEDIVKSELNVKQIYHSKQIIASDHLVIDKNRDLIGGLDTRLDDALKMEGLFRELTRAVQAARKKAQLQVDDKISLTINATDELELQMLKDFMDQICEITKATTVGVSDSSQNHQVKSTGITFEITK